MAGDGPESGERSARFLPSSSQLNRCGEIDRGIKDRGIKDPGIRDRAIKAAGKQDYGGVKAPERRRSSMRRMRLPPKFGERARTLPDCAPPLRSPPGSPERALLIEIIDPRIEITSQIRK
jgi:hypothetical protein